MIEFKVPEGEDPKGILLQALPPLQNLIINSIEQVSDTSRAESAHEDEYFDLEPLSNTIN